MDKRIYKRGTLSLGLLTGVLLALLIVPLFKGSDLVISEKPASKDPLIVAFKASEVKFSEIQIKGWVLVNNKFETVDRLEEYVKALDNNLELSLNELKLDLDDQENFKGLTGQGQVGEYDIELLAQSIRGAEGAEAPPETYIVVTLTGNRLISGYNQTYKELKKGLQQIGPKPQVSVNIIGNIAKEISQSNREEILMEVFNSVQAKTLSRINNDNLTSVAGFTPLVKDVVQVGDEKMNLNAAFRYNFLEEKTYFYLGSPILTTEY